MNTLVFNLSEATSEDGARLLTTRRLAIYVLNIPIWPIRGIADHVEIQIDDLLSYLSEFWKPLTLRQTYPLSLKPSKPSHVLVEALARWAALPAIQVEQEGEVLEHFQDAHDLSRCFAGYFDLPPCWLLRAGYELLVDTGDFYARIPFDAAIESLTKLGDYIVSELQKDDSSQWERLIAAWRNREKAESIDLLAWSTSLERSFAATLATDGTLIPPHTYDEAANDNNELWIAARMASALPPDQVRAIVLRVKQIPKVREEELSPLAQRSRDYFDEFLVHARPYEQGEQMARFVRSVLDHSPTKPFDVFGFIEDLMIPVAFESLEPTLDGIAVWGASHGPAVVLNKTSPRHASNIETWRNGGARVTLAHELCHLLVDGVHTLSAVDVLNSRMPNHIEQRARAFAAEFLLPRRVAADHWIRAGKPWDTMAVSAILDELCRNFSVTKSVAAWKLEHGSYDEGARLGPVLDIIVPQR